MALTQAERALVAQTESARKARNELHSKEREYDETISELQSNINMLQTKGMQQVATMAALGVGLGGGVAYLLHDTVAEQFGRASWPALLILPGAGLFGLTQTQKWFRGKKQMDERALSYGASFGLLIVGGYLSYEDYSAANP